MEFFNGGWFSFLKKILTDKKTILTMWMMSELTIIQYDRL